MQLSEQLLRKIRVQGKSDETAKTYWHWCERFMRFVRDQNSGQWKHPKDCGKPEIEAWLSELANGKKWVSKNTQNVALQSLCYLFREVLGQPLEGVNALRAKRPQRTRDVADVSENQDRATSVRSPLEAILANPGLACRRQSVSEHGLRVWRDHG